MVSLRKLLAPFISRKPREDDGASGIAPETDFAAIGDVHGCLGLLDAIVAEIEQLAPGVPLVFAGDYIDRGEHSAQVLRCLQSLESARPGNVVCLMGNHEEICLGFLQDPERNGPRWLRNGGLQTLASFDLGLGPDALKPGNFARARDALETAMGPDLVGWLKQRPLYWSSGNVAVTHAGGNPKLPMSQQAPKDLLWGHRDFFTTPRRDGLWVVHGHTIVEQPSVVAGRIAIDTGAYATGRLTAVGIQRGGVSFLTT